MSGAVGYDVEWQQHGQSNWQTHSTVAPTSNTTTEASLSSLAGRYRVRTDINGTKSAWVEKGP